jgi:hypothetical protein
MSASFAIAELAAVVFKGAAAGAALMVSSTVDKSFFGGGIGGWSSAAADGLGAPRPVTEFLGVT